MLYAIRTLNSGYWFDMIESETRRALFHPMRLTSFDSIESAQGVIDDCNLHDLCEIVPLTVGKL